MGCERRLGNCPGAFFVLEGTFVFVTGPVTSLRASGVINQVRNGVAVTTDE